MQNLSDVLKQKRVNNHARQLKKRFNPHQRFTERYEDLKNIVVPLSYLFNLASALGALYAIYFAFQFLANSVALAILICGLLLLGIERLKRSIYRSYFDDVVMLHPSSGWLLAVVALVIVSLGSTAFGTYKGTIDFAPAAATLSTDSTLTYLQSQAAQLDDNIQASKKTTWKGKITTRSQSAIKEYSKSQNKLYDAIAGQLQRRDSTNAAIEVSHKDDVQKAALLVMIIAFFIEIALLGCMFFLSKYDAHFYFEVANQSIESSPFEPSTPSLNEKDVLPLANTPTDNPKSFPHKDKKNTNNDNKLAGESIFDIEENLIQPTEDQSVNENRTVVDENREVVSVAVLNGKGLRECENCGGGYIYNHKKQKFCSDKCRMEYWKKH